MISMITGQVAELGAGYAVILQGGLGYKVSIGVDALQALKIGQETKFWTYLAVREDALDLYGFPTKKEKEIFEQLITVSGIGPKSALNILNVIAPDSLISAIQTGSTAHLTKISGIGKKTAEKIVLELRDKLDSFALDDAEGERAGMKSDMDVIEALKALGYTTEESREALQKIGKDVTDVGAKIKAALKLLA